MRRGYLNLKKLRVREHNFVKMHSNDKVFMLI